MVIAAERSAERATPEALAAVRALCREAGLSANAGARARFGVPLAEVTAEQAAELLQALAALPVSPIAQHGHARAQEQRPTDARAGVPTKPTAPRAREARDSTAAEPLAELVYRLQHTAGPPMTGGEVTRAAFGVEWHDATAEQRQAVTAACRAAGLRQGRLVNGDAFRFVADASDNGQQ